MKRLLILACLLTLFLAGCQQKEEIAPEQRPDARLGKVLADYKALLTGSEHGWKAVLYPASGAGYNFLLKFSANDRVVMSSDINAATSATPFETSFRLKAMQQPSLLFDTYSYLHLLADPDPEKSGGEAGRGKYSDFEFLFESATPESIVLRGTSNSSRLVLTRATQADAANYIRNIATTARTLESFRNFTTYFKRLTIGTKAYDVHLDPENRRVSITYFTGETANLFTTTFYYTETGIMFLEPFTHEGTTISGFSGLQYNAGTRRFSLTVANAAATIQEAARPVKVDVQGARGFYNGTSEDYWIAVTGFTVNGVPDALKVSQLPDFYFLAWWPKYGSFQGTSYDLLGFVTFNRAQNRPELNYGPAAVSRLTSDGRVIYSYLGVLGTVPPEAQATMDATREIWTEAQGFYVIRTGNNSVDLVSAKDGKAWISLFQ